MKHPTPFSRLFRACLSLSLGLAMALSGCDRVVPDGHPEADAAGSWGMYACDLGEALQRRIAAGSLDLDSVGPQFWAQFADDVPLDVLAGPCASCFVEVVYEGRRFTVGWCGPDRDVLGALRRGDVDGTALVGSSRFDPNGECICSRRGVAVIRADGTADFLFWDELGDGGSMPPEDLIGPNSTEVRFRHLVR